MAGPKSRSKPTKKSTKGKISPLKSSAPSKVLTKGPKSASNSELKSERDFPQPELNKAMISKSTETPTDASAPNKMDNLQSGQGIASSRPKRYASRNVRLYIAADADNDSGDESDGDIKPSEFKEDHLHDAETNAVEVSDEDGENASDSGNIDTNEIGGGFFDFGTEESTNMDESSDVGDANVGEDDTVDVPAADPRGVNMSPTPKMTVKGKGRKSQGGGAHASSDVTNTKKVVQVPMTIPPVNNSPHKTNKNLRVGRTSARIDPVIPGPPVEDAGSNVFFKPSIEEDPQLFVKRMASHRLNRNKSAIQTYNEADQDDEEHQSGEDSEDDEDSEQDEGERKKVIDAGSQERDEDDSVGYTSDDDDVEDDDDMTLPVVPVRANMSSVQPAKSSAKIVYKKNDISPGQLSKSGRQNRSVDVLVSSASGKSKANPARVSSAKHKKGKGKVVVETIDHKIIVPATFPSDVPTTPVSGKKRMGALPADDTADSLSTSPKKKAKLSKGKGKATAEMSRESILDTPVTGVSRYLAASRLTAGDNEVPDAGPATMKDAVSDPTNMNHRAHMCPDMLPTYEGTLAPPIIRTANKIIMLGPSTDKPFIKFKSAMARVGVTEDSPLFLRVRNLVTQACFGPSLYNPARIDMDKIVYTAIPSKGYTKPRYSYSLNLSGSPAYRADTAIAFVMFGTVVESNVLNSVVQSYGKHRRSICIKTFTTEFLRAVNIFATLWNVEQPYGVQVNKEGGGLTFLTLPTVTPYGPRWVMPVDNVSGSEDDLPETSVGGVAVANPAGILSREDLQKLIQKGTVFNEKLPIYDFTEALRQQDAPLLDQELLAGAEAWTGGEIPAGSFVCVHYVPGPYKRGKKEEMADVDVQLNVLRVVVLATATA